jgi:hypothetical protein
LFIYVSPACNSLFSFFVELSKCCINIEAVGTFYIQALYRKEIESRPGFLQQRPWKDKNNTIQSLVFSTGGEILVPSTCNSPPGMNDLTTGRCEVHA